MTSRAWTAGGLRALGLPERVVDFLAREVSSGAGSIRTASLGGDASDRRYVRLIIEGRDGEEWGSCMLMRLSTPWTPGDSRQEFPFVNIARHLREKRVPVPEVFVDASDEGFVLLEDVGDVTLERYLGGASDRERRRGYERAIDILVRMQSEASRASSRPCHALTYSFDAETFYRELCFFREHALERLWRHPMSVDARTELDEHFRRLCEEIVEAPQVFTHRDYHSRNLMVQADRLTVLDFQDARWGPIAYDLVSLLRDSYVSLPPGEQGSLISLYEGLARRAGLGCPGGEAFQRAFHRTALQRNLKAIGTFAFQAVVKGVDRYLVYIPNTVDSVRLALESDAELAPFKRILEAFVEGL